MEVKVGFKTWVRFMIMNPRAGLQQHGFQDSLPGACLGPILPKHRPKKQSWHWMPAVQTGELTMD